MAVPNKGRLREPALKLLSSAGIEPIYGGDTRALLVPTTRSDVVLVYARADDIPVLVASGAVHLGITGRDLVREAGVDGEVEEVLDLGFGSGRIVVAVPRDYPYEGLSSLEGRRVATKYVNIARRFFEEKGVRVKIMRVSGATEVMPLLGAADAIVDIMSTGTTLRAHGLVPVETVMETSAVLIRGRVPAGLEYTATQVIEVTRSVINARGVKLVLMNVPDEALKAVLSILPSMSGPMVARLESPKPMWEVLVAARESDLPRIIVDARRMGARDIVILGVEKVVP
ncbi:MAG: ATP phosphoribosyltransferase [Crenarchaeota archaeon]|nr:ATP phosphoribosyltransferase [Thermoproteota archaeon]